MARFSRDRGKTWGAEETRSLGTRGAYDTEVEWLALGAFRNATMEFSISEPDEVAFESVCEVEAG